MNKKIVSKFGNTYKVKFKSYDKTDLKLDLYRKYFLLYIKVDFKFIKRGISESFIDFKKEAIEIIELYEWTKGYREGLSSKITEFQEWDGKI